ncbi:MAG: hypothetical protein E7509_04690 [Ruminococcus sp.]|nr:hypothetical protein [Ruminococcus sp.]
MKKLISLLTMIVMLLSMTGCDDKEKKPEMDPESAGEFAVDYMKEKYDVAFDLIDFIVPMGKDYAEIRGYIDNNEEVEYIVYACGDDVDKDDDGYADSYTIIGDNYMCTILEPLIKNDMDKLLADNGFANIELISLVYNVRERYLKANCTGGVSDIFPVCNEKNFVLENMIMAYDLSYFYDISIPENEYYDGFEEDIEYILNQRIGSLISNDTIFVDIYVYSVEDFSIKKEEYVNINESSKYFQPVKKIDIMLK